MALGYEGWAKLKYDVTETLLLCTGASVPSTRLRLESNSGYGGRLKTPTSEIGIGLPHSYDWTSFDGSLNFEVFDSIITAQISPWLFNRQKAGQVSISTRRNNQNIHTECFWNNINLNTSSGSAVEGTISFVAVDSGTYVMGGGFKENKIGSEFFCNPPVGLVVPEPIISNIMIPYWQTNVEIDGSLIEFMSWNIDYSQDIVKFFVCEDNANPIAPKFLAAGPMTVTFSGDYFFHSASPSWTIPDYISTLDVNIGANTLSFARGERNSKSDDVVSGDTPTSIRVDYSFYEIVP